jgi:glycosyltransferase involved in cell wall biosynthesis
MRLFVHDYAGHPFALELSRALARRGHQVRHAYFAADHGPKGSLSRQPDDPPGFDIEPIAIGQAYSKADFVLRHRLDGRYGHAAARAIRRFAPDVVITANTPPNALGPIRAAARRSGARNIIWLQDVFGMAAAALLGRKWAGAGRIAAAYYQALERGAMRRADRIIAISEDFRPYLAKLGVDPAAVAVVANWGPLSEIAPRPKSSPWSDGRGLGDKLVFSYTGTLALKHNPDHLYRLAEAFADRPDVQVRVAAVGVGLDWLRRKAEARPLPNLVVTGLVPMADLADAYGGADVLVALLEEAAGAFSAPSKVLTYLCAARPVLLAAPLGNIAARTVLEAGAGLCVEPHDTEGFIAAARRLADDPDMRRSLGRSGRAYAEANFAIDKVADRFEALLGP